MKRTPVRDPTNASARLRVLDSLVLRPLSVEDFVFGHDCGEPEGVIHEGSPLLSRVPEVRWELLRSAVLSGHAEFEAGDHVEFDVVSALADLRDPAPMHRSGGRWSAVARLTETGHGVWERERDMDWTEFHDQTWLDGVAGDRSRVRITAGSPGTLEGVLDAWRSAHETTVGAEAVLRVAPWDPLYWKTLPVGYASDVLTPFPPMAMGASRDLDIERVLLGWRPWDPFDSRN